MPDPGYPGVYVEEVPSGPRPIAGVPTSITAFVGRAPMGSEEPTALESFSEFERHYGALDPAYPMGYCVRDFFRNGGTRAIVLRLCEAEETGIFALRKIDLFNLLCVAPDERERAADKAIHTAARRLVRPAPCDAPRRCAGNLGLSRRRDQGRPPSADRPRPERRASPQCRAGTFPA